jgi:PAS domain S-box-containing protein
MKAVAQQRTSAGPDRVDATARAVVESAADAIVAFGTDRTVLLWNPAAERMFGWGAKEVLGTEPPTIPEELEAEHNAVLERIRAGGQISFATRRARKDGALLDLRIDVSALRDRDGEIIGWVNVCHRTGADQAARKYMAQRARVVRKLGDVVADMTAQRDLEAVLDRIAASLCELTGADAGGFVLIEDGRLRLVSIDGLPADLRGRTADLPTSQVGELMRSGRTVMMATDEAGFGDLIWSALPGLHTIALALSHVGDRPYGALYALYSRRRVGHVELELLELLAGHAGVALTNAMAFEEVVRQRAHERAVIDASADGIAVLDPDGLIRQWNPAAHKLTGMSAEAVAGKPPPFPVPDPGGPTVTHRLPSGRWLEVMCSGLNGKQEQVVDFRDVTAAKELEEAKDLFLATTSHELRTPITVVQGFASTLASRWDKLTDAERRGAVQTIAERAGSLGRLVEQLLLGSRAGADQLTVTNGAFDLAQLLRGAAVAFRPLSERHVLTAGIPDDLPLAYGDMTATDVIVGQLLENAFKYSPDGGTVTVTARPAGDWIEVTVDDEGIGIAPGDHERIFERFVQGEAGDRRRFGGIGLGLYIVRQLARAQGGEIAASSRAAGGTRMKLQLRRAGRPG